MPRRPRPRNSAQALSELATPVGEVLREMNKTSNNEAARSVLLALAPDGAPPARQRSGVRRRAPGGAAAACADWLRSQGLRDGDITIVVGSGQSRAERGKPRALVELLRTAWRGAGSQTLLDSLPIAGVDGTLAHRMTSGARHRPGLPEDRHALGHARARRLRARARAASVYAVSLVVTDAGGRGAPRRRSTRVVEWVATAG